MKELRIKKFRMKKLRMKKFCMKKLLPIALATALCTVCIGAYAYPEEGTPLLGANSDAALTPQDFFYFADYPLGTEGGCEEEFRVPGPEVVKRCCGEPDSEDVEAGSIWMYYPFGWVLLERDGDAYWGMEVLIDTDALEGPRGLRVGDSVEILLAAFHNEDAGLPMRTDEGGVINLFQVKSGGGSIFQYGYAEYLGGEPGEKLVTIEYGFVNESKPEQRCTVSFEVGEGVISQIRWRVGDYHL